MPFLVVYCMKFGGFRFLTPTSGAFESFRLSGDNNFKYLHSGVFTEKFNCRKPLKNNVVYITLITWSLSTSHGFK